MINHPNPFNPRERRDPIAQASAILNSPLDSKRYAYRDLTAIVLAWTDRRQMQ